MENIMNTFGIVWFFIFFRNSPPSPPSAVATRNHASITQGMGNDFRILLRNRNYMLILGSFSFIFFSYNAIGVNLALLFESHGANSFEDSILGIIFVTVGAVCCFLSGIFLDRTNKYLFALRYVCLGTCISMVTAIFLSSTNQFWALCIFSVMAGMSMVPIVPIAFAFAGEVTYPISPAMVIGLMTTVSNLSLFIIQFLYAYLLRDPTKPKGSYIVFGMMGIEAFIAFTFTCFLKEDLRRLSSVSDVAMMRKNSSASMISNTSNG